MSEPIVVSVPHKLGQAEAVARLKRGFATVRTDYARFMTIDEDNWVDNTLTFRVRALGQTCSGTLEVHETDARLEVMLPWLLAKVAERIIPAIKKEGALLLEKK